MEGLGHRVFWPVLIDTHLWLDQGLDPEASISANEMVWKYFLVKMGGGEEIRAAAAPLSSREAHPSP